MQPSGSLDRSYTLGDVRLSLSPSPSFGRSISDSHDRDRSTPAPLYHGTRTTLEPGDLIVPGATGGATARLDDQDQMAMHIPVTPALDEAIWDAELCMGDGPPRVYVVEPLGPVEDSSTFRDRKPAMPPSMSWRSREPLRVLHEVTTWLHYHGTRAELQPGDLLKPGHGANFGDTARTSHYIYFARTLDAAVWGAELAAGDAPGRVYLVEPTGPIDDDPNLTDKKFRGNPTKSFRSRHPLRIVGELTGWRGHAPGTIQAMKEGLERLAQSGTMVIDD